MTRVRTVWLVLGLLAAATGVDGAEHAAAFLAPGLGARGPGLGGAYAAAVEGAEAVFWNPAGLLRLRGIRLSTSVVPMSLDRLHNSMAAAVNVRGDMAFGIAWVHAGVGDLQGRTVSGVRTGSIDDAENAFFVGVGRSFGDKLSVGFALKILDQRLDVPGWNKAEATGHGMDAGLQFQLNDQLRMAAALRNVAASVEWTVERGANQATSKTDELQPEALLSSAYRPFPALLFAAEVTYADETSCSIGAEWRVDPLLTLRAGARRMPGAESTPESLAAGISLRPMRTETLLFHYAFVTDQLDAGDRSVFGLSMSF